MRLRAALTLFCILLLLLLEFLSIIRGYFNLVVYIGFAFIFWFSFTRMSDIDYDYDNEGIAKAYILGYIAAIINIYCQVMTKFSLVQLLNMGSVLERFGDTTDLLNLSEQGMRLSFNPNNLGCICVQVFLIALLLGNRSSRKTYFPIIIISLLVGLMTQSRTFILATAIAIILYLLLTKKSFKSVIAGLSALFILVLSVYFIAYKWFSSYIEGIVLRMQASDITNGRGDIFHTYNGFITSRLDSFLFGVGLQQYPEKYNYYQSCHNATQEVIVVWGIIGLALVLFFLIRVSVKAYKRIGKENLVFFLPFTLTLIIIQAGQGFRDEVGILRLAVMYSVILIPYKSSIEKSSLK